jgi:hypothetical protein
LFDESYILGGQPLITNNLITGGYVGAKLVHKFEGIFENNRILEQAYGMSLDSCGLPMIQNNSFSHILHPSFGLINVVSL